MISYEEALGVILSVPFALGSEEVDLDRLVNRVLSKDVAAPFDLPIFDNSSMDGYAVCSPVTGPLRLIGEVKAGDPGEAPLRRGTAMRVFTGAPIPHGADAVVMQENVSAAGDVIIVNSTVTPGDFIRRKGEEVRAGQPLIRAGTPIGPAVLGSLAAAGIARAIAWKKPRVAIVETGNELIRPGDSPQAGGVFASNGIALVAAVEALGGSAVRLQVRDDEAAISEVLSDCLRRFDILITSGGVSVGDHDLVRPVLKSLGVEEKFWRVAIRPGKPLYFGRSSGGALVFGLPGNPGSSMVTFLLFVKPLLLSLFGLETKSFEVETDREIEPSPNVDTFMRVTVSGGTASPVEKQGSNMISSVTLADAVIQVPRGSSRLRAGTRFRATPVEWTLTNAARRVT